MDCVWRCKVCGQAEPGTSVGMRNIRDHVMGEHETNPSKDVVGVYDLDAEDFVWDGWGPPILKKGYKEGWFVKEEEPQPEPNKSKNSQDDGKVVEFVEVKARSKGKGGSGSTRGGSTANMGKAYVTMSNVPLHGSVQVFFALSRLMHPDAYPDDTPETMGAWIGHCVDVAMEVNGMGLSNLVAAERDLYGGEGDEELGSESSDGEFE